MEIQALSFDLDGTLYPNRQMFFKSIPFALSNLSLLQAFGKVRKEIRKYEMIDDFSTLQIKLLADEMKITTNQAHSLMKEKIFDQWYKGFKSLKVFPYLTLTLEELKARKIPLSVMSDFPILDRLESLGIEKYWDFSFCSEDTGYLKPHRRPFEKICELFDLPPEKILYVGNSFKYDVLGAKSIGMKVAHLSRRKPKKSPADLTFSHYKEFFDFIIPRLST